MASTIFWLSNDKSIKIKTNLLKINFQIISNLNQLIIILKY